MNEEKVRAMAAAYTAAWSSRVASRVASHYAENGSLRINEGETSMGRAAITESAQAFMTAFPDMVVSMNSLHVDGARARYHWTLTGTNTGPGGTGKRVRFRGYEEWTLTDDGHIAQSLGHFDQAEYEKQLKGGITPDT